ncbi:fimbria/pilus outer membrane usher protein [Escherichia coli]|nr:fimbria/pilus outer membrane usher protein [Escherichia coli]
MISTPIFFDGFSYIGGSISTDDQMLPPNLRGYAPDISGVAHTTAKVTVTQMGRVIYETQVPAGPFRIQDIGDSVSGTLHVRIEEQNGQGTRIRRQHGVHAVPDSPRPECVIK